MNNTVWATILMQQREGIITYQQQLTEVSVVKLNYSLPGFQLIGIKNPLWCLNYTTFFNTIPRT